MDQPLRKHGEIPHIRNIDFVISRRMKEIRETKNVSVAQVASELDISVDLLRKYETGARKMPALLLFRMAQVVHVNLSSVFSDAPLSGPHLLKQDHH